MFDGTSNQPCVNAFSVLIAFRATVGFHATGDQLAPHNVIVLGQRYRFLPLPSCSAVEWVVITWGGDWTVDDAIVFFFPPTLDGLVDRELNSV